MDSFRGKHHHSFKAYKSTSPYSRHLETNHCNTPSNHGIFRSRIQRHNLKWKKDYYHRGNYRSRPPYRKSDINSKKSNKTAEDEEEEERKKKLNDTAKKLLSKIKTWNAEKNCSEDDSLQNNINEVVSESSCKSNEEKINSEGKPKRIAHSKKAKLVKSRAKKSFSQSRKTTARYDVNKETLKDFQSRIQHKLIEEIMQMPKENLQNVLNDPKINPIMEKKMSRLVRENRPLIAQKLRALAESKMQSFDYSTNPDFLDDIDKLIDPVIETDLSVLPFELIKQMENIFQVQFDYSPNNPDSLVENDASESAIGSVIMTGDIATEINNLEQVEQVVKAEVNEDLTLYECSTDEDEEISVRKSVEFDSEHNPIQQMQESNKNQEDNERRTLLRGCKQVRGNNIEGNSSTLKIGKQQAIGQNNKQKSSREDEVATTIKSGLTPKNLISNQEVPEKPIQSASKSVEFASTSCQTDCNYKDALTQTETSGEVETLYGTPLPKEAADESTSSLLNEVNSIQILTNKLNERRLMIFLQLAKTNPSGSFIGDDVSKNNFIESVSNGNLTLVESLTQFFSVHQLKNHKYSERGSSESGRKPAEWWKNKNRPRNREEKRSNRHS